MTIEKNKKISIRHHSATWFLVFLMAGLFLFGKNVLAVGDYNKVDGSRLNPDEWNNLINDYVTTWATSTMAGPLGIGTAPSSALDIFGKLKFTSGGTIYNTDSTRYLDMTGILSDSLKVSGDLYSTAGELKIAGTGISYLMGNVGIGVTNPAAKLDIVGGNIDIDNTTFANQNGIITKNGARFIHNFNYGNNGTVTTDGGNTFVGLNAGNLTMGSTATHTYDASYNTALGQNVLLANTTGYFNSAFGNSALSANTTGYNNSVLGVNALRFNTAGSGNSVLGVNALYNNIAGNNGVAIGYQSQYYVNSTTTAWTNTNTSVGYQALLGSATAANNTGLGNSAFGFTSLYSNSTGSNNTALGQNALLNNTTGNNNTAVGLNSLYSIAGGSQNSALGQGAGRYIANGTTGNVSSNNSLYLGYYSKALADGDNNETVIGFNATGIGSNSVVLGNDSVVTTALKGNVGIGTTTPVTARLVVNPSGSYSIDANNGRIGNVGSPVMDSDAATVAYVKSIAAGTSTVPTVGYWTANGNNIYSANSGNVGIGTTNPTYKLHVSGEALVSSYLNVSGSIFGQKFAPTGVSVNWIGALRDNAYRFSFQNASSSELMVIGGNGNVGIGTSNPGAKLNIIGDFYADGDWSNDTAIRIREGGDNTYGAFFKYGSSDLLTIGTRGGSTTDIVAMQIGRGSQNVIFNGNVGIGTTAPVYKLDVAGTAQFTQPVIVGTPTAANHAITKSYFDSAIGDPVGAGTAGQTLRNDGNGWVANSTLFNNGNNVGIGTTNPGAKLDISNSALTEMRLSNTNVALGTEQIASFLSFYNNDASSNGTGVKASINAISDSSYGNSIALTFNTSKDQAGTSEQMRITGTGNVGIGSTAPAYTLDVAGTGRFTQPLIVGTPTATNHAATKSYVDSAAASAAGASWTVNGNNIYNSNSGNVGIGTATPGAKFEVYNNAAYYAANLAAVNNSLIAFRIKNRGTFNTALAIGAIGSVDKSGIQSFDISDNSAKDILLNPFGGNIGIGTTNPVYKLQLNQSDDTHGIRVYGSTVPTSYFDMYINSLGNPRFEADGTHSMIFTAGGGIGFRTSGTGNLTFNDINPGFTSFNAGQMVITAAGNVGIGTTAPSYKLDVAGTGQFTQPLIVGTPTAANHAVTKSYFDSAIGDPVGAGAAGQTLRNDGNGWVANSTLYNNGTYIGIGTTNPQNRLDIISTTGASVNESNTTIKVRDDSAVAAGIGGAIMFTGKYSGNTYLAGAPYIKAAKDNATEGDYGYGLKLATRVNGGGIIEALNILGNGNVGIGTTNPTRLLNVHRAGTGEIGLFEDGTQGILLQTTSGLGSIIGYNGTSYNPIEFRASASVGSQLYLNTIGNVGIGTTVPSYKLDVAGTGQFTQPLIVGTPTAANHAITKSYFDSAIGDPVGAGTAGQTLRNDGNGWVANSTLFNNGANVGIGTTAPTAKLDVVGGNIDLDNTSTSSTGMITKNGTIFIHDFNYGNNGTVTTVGQNTFVGIAAGNLTMGSTATAAWQASYNSVFGRNALYNNTTGYSNSVVGYGALQNNTTGYTNSAIGESVLRGNTTGNNNSAIGYQAGRYIADGSTANQTTSNSNYLGYNTKALADGDTNETVIGYNATGLGSNSVVLGNDSVTKTVLKGNVGIGSTAPAYKLDVAGTGQFTQPLIVGTPTATNHAATKSYVDSAAASAAGASWTVNGNNIYNSNSGNVGIGTANPAYKLHVLGSGIYIQSGGDYYSRLFGEHYTAGEEPISLITSVGSASNNSVIIGGGTSIGNAATQISLYTASNATTTTGTERLRISSSGNVGIGSTAPSYKLDVAGTGQFTQPLIVGTPTAANHAVTKSYLDSALGDPVGAGTAGQTLRHNGTNWVANSTIYNNGTNVGIGTTNPGYKLDVNGQMRAERYRGINSLVLNTFATVNPASNVFLYSQPNDRDSWIYLDGADTGSNWGMYHRQIDSSVSGLPANSIGFIGGGSSSLQAFIGLADGSAFFKGNVGIGTMTPAYKLDVAGTGRFTQPLIVGTPTATNHAATKSYVDSAAGGGVGAGTSGQTLRHNGTNWVANSTLFNDGNNVGIGTSNPLAKLDVNGSIYANNLFNRNGAGIGQYDYEWRVVNVSTNTGERTIATFDAGTVDSYDGVEVVGEVIDDQSNWGDGTPIVSNFRARLRFSGGTSYTLYQDRVTPNITLSIREVSASVAKLTAICNNPHKDVRVKFKLVEGDSSSITTTLGNPDIIDTTGTTVVAAPSYMLDFSGYVGIGSTIPSYNLDVNGTGRFTQPLIVGTPTAASHAATKSYVDSAAASAAGASWTVSGNNIYNSNAGNVGIGTANPGGKLEVQAGTDNPILFIRDSGSTGQGIALNFNSNGNFLFGQSSSATAKDFILDTRGATGANMRFRVDGSEKVTILNNGNVGIGTNNPNTKLDVSGILSISNGAGTYWGLDRNDADGSLTFSNATTERMRILQDGSFGIGSTAPAYKLDVVGGGQFTLPVTVGTPTAASHAATKSYVDSAAGGGIGAGTSGQTLRHNGTNWIANSNLFNNGTNIGIGTTNPTAKLDVSGSSARIKDTVWGWSNVSSNPASTIYFKIATLPVSSAGTYDDVEIQGVLGGWASVNKTPFNITFGNRESFSYKYDSYGPVYSAARILAYTESDGSVSIYVMQQSGAYTTASFNIESAINATVYPNPTSTTTAPSGTLAFDSSTTMPRLLIDNFGNVGIGSTAPTYKLDVAGTGRFTQPLIVGTPTAASHAATKSYVDSAAASAAGASWTVSGNNIYNSNSGNVGIGTASPTAKLDLIGGNFDLDNTTFANQNGMITKNGTRFISDFNYGNNGTVTTVGQNTFVGLNAGNLTMGSTATTAYQSSYNTAVGSAALQNNTTGFSNSVLGYAALFSNTTGLNNSAVGESALRGITTGSNNSAIGYQAGRYIADGSTANQTSNTSVYLGYNTMALASGDANETVIGSSATGIGSNSVVLGNDSVTKTALKGNVGIGTTVPAYKLDVAGTGQFTQPLIVGTPTASNHAVTKSYLDSALGDPVGAGTAGQTLRNDGTSWVANSTIYNNGTNVGIGTASPQAKLDVNGMQIFYGEGIPGTYTYATTSSVTLPGTAGIPGLSRGLLQTYNSDFTLWTQRNYGSDNTEGVIAFGDDSSSGLSFEYWGWNGSGTSRPLQIMSMKSSGNVGIGNANPSAALDIFGKLKLTNGGTIYNTDSGRWLDMTGTLTDSLKVSGDLYSTAGELKIAGTGASYLMGSVGIGTTNPSEQLTVAKLNATNDSRIKILSDGTTDEMIGFANSTANNIWTIGRRNTAHTLEIGFQTGTISPSVRTGNAVSILTSGNVGIGTTSPTEAKLVINAGTGMALKAYGNGIFTGTLQTQTGSDFAEEFVTSGNLEPGTVVVMDDNGHKSVKPCAKSYDKTVVGIVSNDPSIIAGRVNSEHKAIIAMMGVVKVKVSNINGNISKGDLLTTSGIYGYAMKANDTKPGTVIGKALENLNKATGEINVLVNLQ